VIVSYNGDLRGIVEDMLKKTRRARCSVSSFSNLGALLDGTSLVATVPEIVAAGILALRPHLRRAALPFALSGAPLELLWPATVDDDEASRFVRERVVHIAQEAAARLPAKGRRRASA
jgi:LysR family transcriptional activator of mexEF-oprN operon